MIIKLLLAVFCLAMLIVAIQPFNKYGFSFSLKQKQPLICKIRSQSQTILKESSKIDFGLNNYCRPIKYVENDYAINENGTIKDKTTGLIWQQSGSDTYMQYEDAIGYVHKMNRIKFAGLDDWRIPTLPELISIIEQDQNTQNLYIHPNFNPIQKWVWSSDKISTDSMWLVDFFEGNVFWGGKKLVSYVRAVHCSP
ncbi:MAG: hypothetical protein A2328_02315 [Bdellovibrionales bacterium RIFOXYB2_FULL_36_6]|nr:MAG: hypothetical protein A2328_02315 [Bdellovibrionales bacterium RIFOXYB2_FULL_36_6]